MTVNHRREVSITSYPTYIESKQIRCLASLLRNAKVKLLVSITMLSAIRRLASMGTNSLENCRRCKSRGSIPIASATCIKKQRPLKSYFRVFANGLCSHFKFNFFFSCFIRISSSYRPSAVKSIRPHIVSLSLTGLKLA